MSVAAYAIASLADCKAYLKIATDDTSQDSFIEGIIDRVSGFVEGYCGRKIAVQSVENEVYDGDGCSFILPRHWPVTQLSTASTPSDAQKLAAVQYRDYPGAAWTDIVTDVNNVFIGSQGLGIYLYGATFPKGVQNIRLNYKAGLSSPDIDEIEQVVIEMVAVKFKESNVGEGRLGKNSENNGQAGYNGSVSFRDLRPQWTDILDRYRVRNI